MKNTSKAKIITIFAIMIVIVSAFAFFWLQKDDEADEIIEKTLNAFENVKSYKYISSGSLMTNEINGVDKPLSGGPYTLNCEVDISNKKLVGQWTFTNESSESFNYSYYFFNGTLYSSNDNITWDTHGSDNVWYSFSHLDRILSFMLKNATLKQLDNEIIDGNECFVIKVTPNINDAELRQAYIDFLLPYRYAESGYEEDWAYTYDTDVKYWVEKDSYLIKKATFDVMYNLKYSFYPYESTELSKINHFWNYATEIVFYDYGEVGKIESPWKSYEDEAELKLSHLNYSNIRFGFGFNPPDGWSIAGNYYIGMISTGTSIPLFCRENDSYSNISIYIGPLSRYHEGNLIEQIEKKLEQLNETINQNENYTLESHIERTVNGMNAYEFVTTNRYDEYVQKVKEIYVEKDNRIFTISIQGHSDLFDTSISEIENSLNSSFTIITPYFEIY